jgi:putative endonuclease
MMTTHSWRTKFGLAGEKYAERLLQDAGLQIEARRFRCRGGEVDLVARDGTALVFVEVKTRRSSRFGDAIETISWRKKRYLLRAAGRYLRRSEQSWRVVQFDVIGLASDSHGRLSAQWVRDAFRTAD